MIPAVLGLTAWIAKGVELAALPRLLKAVTNRCSPTPKGSPNPPVRLNHGVWEKTSRAIVSSYDNLSQLIGGSINQTPAAMTAIVDGGHRSEFAYDGAGRRIKIAEFDNGNLTSKKLYWWLGGEIVCERDGIDPGFLLTKRYFGQGVQVGGQNLYYTFDQLGSVRELVDSSGVVRADYRYSTYGERTKESGEARFSLSVDTTETVTINMDTEGTTGHPAEFDHFFVSGDFIIDGTATTGIWPARNTTVVHGTYSFGAEFKRSGSGYIVAPWSGHFSPLLKSTLED